MQHTLAFDVYGTLINTHGLTRQIASLVGDEQAAAFSQTWRDKQLEYSFRRGLMQLYAPFSVCTAEALDYTCQRFACQLSSAQREALLNGYRQLPAFDDALTALSALKAKQVRCFAFSNGSRDAVVELLTHAQLIDLFDDVVSVEPLCSFKPNPAVYSHFLRATHSQHHRTSMISSNPFDVIGAKAAGMGAVWIKRDPQAVFDPWGILPDHELGSLHELPGLLG